MTQKHTYAVILKQGRIFICRRYSMQCGIWLPLVRTRIPAECGIRSQPVRLPVRCSAVTSAGCELALGGSQICNIWLSYFLTQAAVDIYVVNAVYADIVFVGRASSRGLILMLEKKLNTSEEQVQHLKQKLASLSGQLKQANSGMAHSTEQSTYRLTNNVLFNQLKRQGKTTLDC